MCDFFQLGGGGGVLFLSIQLAIFASLVREGPRG
jgi:hypothetical protein